MINTSINLQGPKTSRKKSDKKFDFESSVNRASTFKLKGIKTHVQNTPLLSERDRNEDNDDKKSKKSILKFDIMHFFKTFKDEKKVVDLPNIPLDDEEAQNLYKSQLEHLLKLLDQTQLKVQKK